MNMEMGLMAPIILHVLLQGGSDSMQTVHSQERVYIWSLRGIMPET